MNISSLASIVYHYHRKEMKENIFITNIINSFKSGPTLFFTSDIFDIVSKQAISDYQIGVFYYIPFGYFARKNINFGVSYLPNLL